MHGSSAHPKAESQRVLLIASGNTFRGDDGIGWYIGHAEEQQPPCSGVTVLLTRQLLPEHAEDVSAADVVVFVDCDATSIPGVVSSFQVQPAEKLPQTLTHHLDPASLLRLSIDLYGRAPTRAVLVTVGGESFEWTDRLSGTAKAAVPKALAEVRRVLLDGPGAAAPLQPANPQPGATRWPLC